MSLLTQAIRSTWSDINSNGTSNSDSFVQRPTGTHILDNNTTLIAAWIDKPYSNVTATFNAHQRIINNVTMAMPHPGVYAAAADPTNSILQPTDLDGVGEYMIHASVVSPVVNVMCVNMDQDELAPLVYTTWPNAKSNTTVVPKQSVGYPGWQNDVPPFPNWLNSTVVDDIFRWGQGYCRRPPVFQMVRSLFGAEAC